MAAISNLTVFKADGVTNIVYDGIVGSGGDKSPALWRQDTGAIAGLPVGLRPTFRMLARNNGPKTARIVETEYVAPYATQDTTTTRYSAEHRSVIKSVSTLPQGIPASILVEAIYQEAHLRAHAVIKAAAATGYAPT